MSPTLLLSFLLICRILFWCLIIFLIGADATSQKIQGLGDKVIVNTSTGQSELKHVGAGGWGGGVHLVTSDEETQEVNRVNLERFLKRQRKEKLRREKEHQKEN